MLFGNGTQAFLAAGVLCVLSGVCQGQGSSPQTTDRRALLDKYCVTCHNQKLKTAGLMLDQADPTKVSQSAELWEKVVFKLHGGMMPPVGMPRPDKTVLDGFIASVESDLDRAYFAKINPGRVALHRLNRAEYANAVHDLLAIDVEGSTLLPPDDSNFGFDNIADSLTVSPSLLERYLSAAWKISRLAVGDPKYIPGTQVFHTPPDLSQHTHIEGLPLGTRGGILVNYDFPLDAEYVLKVELWKNTSDGIRGLELPSQVEITLDGERIHLAKFGGNGERRASELAAALEIRVPVKAGPHAIGAALIADTYGPPVDLLQPFQRENLDPLTAAGIATIDALAVTGPYNPAGPGDTPSRRRIFTCHPTGGSDEIPCAKAVLNTLARRAYRKPLTDSETERLLSFFQRGRNEGSNFDAGIETALAFILSSPEFLFRAEPEPKNLAAGTPYRISDLELASRLSFFLWSTIPDDELLNVAMQGQLHERAVLEREIRRMLADSRSKALVSNFLAQWLYLRNLKSIAPDKVLFPDFDDNLRVAFQRETELLFESVMREDRNVVDLLRADYTFVNERLAKHYGIPNVYGEQFRKIVITDETRKGLLGQGSVLMVTSQADRTSPVLRGKWILTNILGTPPPPPPPNVPPLDEIASGTMRQRMEQHRANVACAGCHRVMDPLGLSLENFDAVGHWRTTEAGTRIDATGTLADGAKVDGPVALRNALLSRPEQFVRTVTQMLLTYALGRGLEYYDMPVVRGITKQAASEDYRFSSLVIGVVTSPPFQMRMKTEEKKAVADAGSRNPAAKGPVRN